MIKCAPRISAVTVNCSLKIDSASSFQCTNHEGIHGDEFSGVVGNDMALSKLRAEVFEQVDLIVAELDLALTDMFFQS